MKNSKIAKIMKMNQHTTISSELADENLRDRKPQAERTWIKRVSEKL
jgi:hypothetical protein